MNQDFKKIKERLFSCSLLLSLMLTGCGYERSYYVGGNLIKYNGGKASGSIDYEEIEKSVKIITFAQEDVAFTKSVIITKRSDCDFEIAEYVDMETGLVLIGTSTYSKTGDTTYTVGEKLEILEVKDFEPYLFANDYFKLKYDISYLIGFYQNKVEPTLEANHILNDTVIK